jgi:hypothetical protein
VTAPPWTYEESDVLGITVPWSLMQGADTLMRRHATDLDGLVSSTTGLLRDFDGLAGGGYGELPAGRFPAFASTEDPHATSSRWAIPPHLVADTPS